MARCYNPAVRRIGRYFFAIAHHWGSLVTGGTLIGLLGIWQSTGHFVGIWVYWGIAIGALLMASFKAWDEQLANVETLSNKNKKLEWPSNRPQISFLKWGQVERESGAAIFQHGFYLENHGGPALEVKVERFEVADGQWADSKAIPTIGHDSIGFAPVWLENVSPIVRFSLDVALEAAVEKQIKDGRLQWAEDYCIKVSAVYRDFNHVWYKSKTKLRYLAKQNRITFDAVTQESRGFIQPTL